MRLGITQQLESRDTIGEYAWFISKQPESDSAFGSRWRDGLDTPHGIVGVGGGIGVFVGVRRVQAGVEIVTILSDVVSLVAERGTSPATTSTPTTASPAEVGSPKATLSQALPQQARSRQP